MGKKNLFHSPDHVFQSFDMVFESFFAGSCYSISGIGLAADKSLVHFYKAAFLQRLQVCGQVAVGYLQHLLQVIEVHFLVYHEDTHHAKPNAVVENFIQS